jgi:hypothetical protein
MRVRWTVPAADDLESIKNYAVEILHIHHGAQDWR